MNRSDFIGWPCYYARNEALATVNWLKTKFFSLIEFSGCFWQLIANERRQDKGSSETGGS